MADKTYKMLVTLSNGSTIDAGTFVAPQGPKGDTGEIPASLPVTYKKVSGELPTTGWRNAQTDADIWNGNIEVPNASQTHIVKLTGNLSAIQKIRDAIENEAPLYAQWDNNDFRKFTYQGLFNGYYEWKYNTNYYIQFRGSNGFNDIYFKNNGSASITLYAIATSSAIQTKKLFTISDTDITANTSVKMYLTDEGGVKAQSKASGSITVIRDTAPTVAIPYEYEVEQTSAEGAFEIVNSYLPTIPETPTALPQTAGALKSGNLPTTGWTNVSAPLWQGMATFNRNGIDKTFLCNIGVKWNNRDEMPLTGWAIDWSFIDSSTIYTINTLKKNDDVSKNGIFYGFGSGNSEPYLEIDVNGDVYGWTQYDYLPGRTIYKIEQQSLSKQGYTISDTSITANSDILMELTDEGGVKANALVNGSITVIRDTVPTQPILYTYKVKQTNASGQFTVINHYTPEIPEVPTTTTLYEDSTGAATVTLSETINNGDIVRIKTNNGNVDHYYIGVAWNRAITVTESLMVTDESDVTVGTAINIYSLRFNIQDTSLILAHYFKTNITTAGAVTITNEKTNVVIRKVERIHA